MSDLWHATIQGWRLRRFLGVWLMWTRFLPRVRLSRQAGAIVTWDDARCRVHFHYPNGGPA